MPTSSVSCSIKRGSENRIMTLLTITLPLPLHCQGKVQAKALFNKFVGGGGTTEQPSHQTIHHRLPFFKVTEESCNVAKLATLCYGITSGVVRGGIDEVLPWHWTYNFLTGTLPCFNCRWNVQRTLKIKTTFQHSYREIIPASLDFCSIKQTNPLLPICTLF